MKKIFLFEDEIYIATDMSQILENEGFDVCMVHSLADAMDRIKKDGATFDIALLDIKQEMPLIEDAGIQIAQAFNKLKSNFPVIFLTAYPDSFVKSLDVHPVNFFDKGITDIERAIPRAIRLAINNLYNDNTDPDVPDPANNAISSTFPGKLCIKVRKNPDSCIYSRKVAPSGSQNMSNWELVMDDHKCEEILRLIDKNDLAADQIFDFILISPAEIVRFEFNTKKEERYREFMENNRSMGVYHSKVEVNFLTVYTHEGAPFNLENYSAVQFKDIIKKIAPDTSFIQYDRGKYVNPTFIKKFDASKIFIGEKFYKVSASGYAELREAFFNAAKNKNK